jgi:hypothetical protein
MKTKIRSLIIICALGIVGTLNTNATSSHNTSSATSALEEAKNVKIENLNSSGFVFTEDADSEIDYEKEAQLVTKWVADQKEAKAIQVLFNNLVPALDEVSGSLASGEEFEDLNSAEFVFTSDTNAMVDYQKEAQVMTKWIADKQETKVIQKLIDSEKCSENK